MSRWLSLKSVPGAWDGLGKLLISALVVVGFLLVLSVVTAAHTLLLDSQAKLRAPLTVAKSSPVALPRSREQTPWPRFPRSVPSNARRSTINGVDVVSEDWECLAAPLEVLGYYREQMLARGWRDVTEETFGLRPETHNLRDDGAGLQDPRYLQTYRSVMESKLVLSRGDWSMHVMTEPAKTLHHGISVRLYAAATPSVADYAGKLLSTVAPGDARGNKASRSLDAVQHSGGNRYHTTITPKSQPPAEAFQEALNRLRAEDWRPALMSPAQPTRGVHFAWLVRGQEYAVVSAKTAPSGEGAVVSLTEVTPE